MSESLMLPLNHRPRELDPVEGVGWGNQGTVRIVSGPTYQNIELVTDITDPADIERVTLKLNGKEIVNLSGQDIVDINEHRKQYVEPGRYVIPFADFTMRTKAGVRLGELVTLAGEIWTMYIQLRPKSDAPAPSIRARAHTTAAQSRRVYLPRFYSISWTSSAAGRQPHDFAERSPFLSLKRAHFKDPSIDRIRVIRDGREEMNVQKIDNAFDLKKSGVEQNDGWFSLDFVADGFGMESRLKTNAAQQLAFEVDKQEAGGFTLLIEAIEQVAPINPPKATA